ncbi:MAG TPA: hypothetical protein VEC35_16890 [Noviherbaspirillum sp.]|nr:hypothetical protein [Noviherbaspirillum sp.]
MAANTRNKYPADKTGTKYSEFRNTKRTPPGKTVRSGESRHSGTTEQTAGKTA